MFFVWKSCFTITVLHYPTLKEFRKELGKGYDYVGFSFSVPTLHKIVPMIKIVRRFSPEAKIILGGYGTVLPDDKLKDLADHVCREEGIGFMRRLLGEPERLFRSPVCVYDSYIFSLKAAHHGVIFGALGCPYGCDFCIPSNFFKKEKIYFYTDPKKLLEDILKQRSRDPSIGTILILDDDFLFDEPRARRFLEAARGSGKFLDIMIFASMQSLSRFTFREIAQMGVSKIWIGFEGKQAGYEKLKGGSFRQTAEQLRSYGIDVIASMIIGYDYQDEQTILDEIEDLILAKPYLTQIAILTPCIGTPLWEKFEKESRIRSLIRDDYRFYYLWSLFEHPKISVQKMEYLQRRLYHREYEALGPSLFRMFYTMWRGYERLKDDPDPVLHRRALDLKARLRIILPLYLVGTLFISNRKIKEQLKQEYAGICKGIGRPHFLLRVCVYAIIPFILWTKLRFHFKRERQPFVKRREYNTK
ncbi:MAG: hypothetical protein PHW98_05285 [Candidatus Omnitrophica bacterium]|nr:hypothetical protein [Candidatus Omnitrophota bacterium]